VKVACVSVLLFLQMTNMIFNRIDFQNCLVIFKLEVKCVLFRCFSFVSKFVKSSINYTCINFSQLNV